MQRAVRGARGLAQTHDRRPREVGRGSPRKSVSYFNCRRRVMRRLFPGDFPVLGTALLTVPLRSVIANLPRRTSVWRAFSTAPPAARSEIVLSHPSGGPPFLVTTRPAQPSFDPHVLLFLHIPSWKGPTEGVAARTTGERHQRKAKASHDDDDHDDCKEPLWRQHGYVRL